MFELLGYRAGALPPFAFRLPDGTVVASKPGEPPRFTVALKRPEALDAVLVHPDLRSLGEAYLRDDLDVEGDIEAVYGLVSLLTMGGPQRSPQTPPIEDGFVSSRSPRSPQVQGGPGVSSAFTPPPVDPHQRERDAAAIRYHYDLSNEVYGLVTGATRMYSAAYYHSEDDSLDDAQRQKLSRSSAKLDLSAGERLLDIGCGWGGMMAHAVTHHGVEATGVTVSEQQARLCAERFRSEGIADRCTVHLQDYRDIDTSRPFDKVVSLGMVEHVGLANLPVYFAKVFAAVRPGGRFLLQGVSACAGTATIAANPFTQSYLFPDAEMPYLLQYLTAAEEAGFEVRGVENMREHYALTHRAWRLNLERHEAAITAEVGMERYRALRLLYSYSTHHFFDGLTTVSQILLLKPPGARALFRAVVPEPGVRSRGVAEAV
jgi:cyclopropane-fatty-acyl-phospholipid synthase